MSRITMYQRNRALFASSLLACVLSLLAFFWLQLPHEAAAQTACPQIQVPAITHGFTPNEHLPYGDHFLLPQPFTLTLPSSAAVPGFSSFPVNATTFGGDVVSIGGYPGTTLTGTTYSMPGGNVTLLSCVDSVWDVGFALASLGATNGDTVTLFLQKPDGSGVQTLAVFTHEAGGARVTTLHPNLMLFRENRLGNAGRLVAGDFIPFDLPGGTAGKRSSVLILAFEMRADSPLNGCFQFGATTTRGTGLGASSLVFTDFVLKRMEQAGDRERPGTGLLQGLPGGYPTALVCPVLCPECPPPPTPCPQIAFPAITHGFTTSAAFPQGDHFLLPQPFTLSAPAPAPVAGFSTFPVNPANFGGTVTEVGGYPGTSLNGLSYAAAGGKITLLSCLDSLWDVGFILASNGATAGDTLTFFVQKPDGSGVQTLAIFTYEDGGARLTALHPNVFLFRNDRMANTGRIQVGEFIAFNNAAGAAGQRSDLLVLAFEMRADSPLNDCFQFGTTMQRGSGAGTAALVFTDFVLKRMEQAGDRALPGAGLLGGLTGGYPTGVVCPLVCPTCPPPPTACPQIPNPAITHGFITAPNLPQGDHFLLPQPFVLTVPSLAPLAGFNTFPINPATFGGDVVGIGGYPGTTLTGFGYATPNGSVTALSCLDSIWDIGFVLASAGATVGDKITLFVQKPDGSGVQTLAVFTYEDGGVRLTALHPNVFLFNGDRLGNTGRLQVGAFIPFANEAGAAGRRTGLLVLAFEMRADSPLNDCFQFGTTIQRGAGVGTAALVFTDFILKRMELPNDRTRPGVGLLGGLTGGYPTGLICPELCPACPPPAVIACPPNQSVCVEQAGAGATVVNYPTPTAQPAGVAVTCTPASGSSFPLGVTTVTCTATSGGVAAACSFTVTVTPRVALTCPSNLSVPASGPGGIGANVDYPLPQALPTGTPVTCTPPSGTAFPLGTTTVTCTASSACNVASCSFTVSVGALKCDTFCWRSPQWWLLNLHRVPRGDVWISGVNNNAPVGTNNTDALVLALQGNAAGGPLTPQQRFNQEYVAAQLNLLLAGGGGSPTYFNVQWTNLSCYGFVFAPVPLSSGVTLTRDSMVKELFMHAQFTATQNRTADFAPLAELFDLFNGDALFGCN